MSSNLSLLGVGHSVGWNVHDDGVQPARKRDWVLEAGQTLAAARLAARRALIQNGKHYIPVQLDSFQAIKIGHFQAFKTLCDRVQDIKELEKPGPDGHTRMHWASKRQDTRFIEYLADRGCNLSLKSLDAVGMTPIHWACTESSIAVINLLLNRGVSIDDQDSSGCTPLLVASQYGHATLVGYLIKKGASVTILDHNSDSALHWAAYKGDVAIVGLLHHLGLRVDAVDGYGQTPLHLSALRGNKDVVEYLIEDGKSKAEGIKDKEGKTPLDLAIKKKKEVVVNILEEHMKAGKGGWGISFKDLSNPRKIKELFMGGGKGVEHQKWPYWFVVGHMSLGLLMYPARILSTDVLIDCSTLHVFTLMCMAATWTFFFLTSKTDPGLIDERSKDPALRMLAARLRSQYDDVLENLGRETTNDGRVAGELHPPLCHTCHIVRPLRSKHCRVKRKCTLMFDHYCPFVGNGVGMGNYMYFILYLTFHCLAMVGYNITMVKYLHRNGWDWMVGTLGVYVGMFLLPGLGMVSYHIQLIAKNLTTNEHANLFRYKYLHDSGGRYRNPWDQGIMGNLYERFINPSERCYVIPGDGDREGEKDDLLANAV
ncbi:hypothetical protein TrCOL_g7652 [Triparma columacea]|uniref:Palmitoyltransferase n=1 Tax=Triparma columacea TaxID=722753 RepID=A0A9W7GDZ9_9STRA|nr:hypothetical protein TrCOL_g7652 [Triparma columacea]